MPVISVVSRKGGSGKTTVAVHLAVAGHSEGKATCVIDTDPQASAAIWGDWRGNGTPPEVLSCPPLRLRATIDKLRQGGTEIIVIDTPPHADDAAREAVRAADLVVIPTRPRSFDLQALEGIAEIVAFSKKPGFVLVNSVPPRGSQILAHAAGYAEALGLQVCPVHFGERGSFHHYSAAGAVAGEMDPEGKAAAEAAALWQWAKAMLKLE
jgi:chromosome partitioning protein